MHATVAAGVDEVNGLQQENDCCSRLCRGAGRTLSQRPIHAVAVGMGKPVRAGMDRDSRAINIMQGALRSDDKQMSKRLRVVKACYRYYKKASPKCVASVGLRAKRRSGCSAHCASAIASRKGVSREQKTRRKHASRSIVCGSNEGAISCSACCRGSDRGICCGERA